MGSIYLRGSGSFNAAENMQSLVRHWNDFAFDAIENPNQAAQLFTLFYLSNYDETNSMTLCLSVQHKYVIQHKNWKGRRRRRRTVNLVPWSCRVMCKQVVTRDEGTKGKCNKSQEGHPDWCTSHYCELIFPPVWLPIINPACCWWGCWYEKIS